ncbi:MAG: endo-1,4-beta-xylanase [Thermoguttaceae bacterium]
MVDLRLMAVTAMAAGMLAGAAIAADPNGDELWAGAAARIERHRKADATVVVLDAAGRPVPDAAIRVEQTRHAFLFGCNIFLWGHLPDDRLEQAYRGRFAELLNYATLPFYWWMYEPAPGKTIAEHDRAVAAWCQKQGIATKGHPLMWNYAEPAWLPAAPEEVHRLQLARVEDCATRFRGLIDRWDVVNEATQFDREECAKQAPKLTATWKQYGQAAMPRECFLAARRGNPAAVLVINDYRTDPAYARLIEQLVAAGGKRVYDVIGIQSHMHASVWPNRQIWEVCERFARFGVPLHFTETTILSGNRVWDQPRGSPWPSTPEGEAFQAREVERFYTMLFSHPAVEAITWWDFSDRGAWKAAPAGLVRKDMTPKPAYDALKRLVKGAWWSTAQVRSGPDGTVGFRGFLGEYRLTVRAGGKPAVVAAATLAKDKPNRWTVKIE